MDRKDGIGVACDLIVSKGNKVLMGKRGHVFGEGTWALPGGHLEVNEKVGECAARELYEEVGIKPDKIELIGIINDVKDVIGQARHYIRFVFDVTSYSGIIANKEPDLCYGWEWVDKYNLPEPLFVGHVKILKHFLKDRKKFFYE